MYFIPFIVLIGSFADVLCYEILYLFSSFCLFNTMYSQKLGVHFHYFYGVDWKRSVQWLYTRSFKRERCGLLIVQMSELFYPPDSRTSNQAPTYRSVHFPIPIWFEPNLVGFLLKLMWLREELVGMSDAAHSWPEQCLSWGLS